MEVTVKDEFSYRHQAIKWRLAGRAVDEICQVLGPSHDWFHTWWRRYQAMGVPGLYDQTRTNYQPPRISPDLERSILSIRRRVEAQPHPQTRYSLIGASAILAELKALHIHPLPCERTVERVLERNGVTSPRVRLARFLPKQVYPTPQAQRSNQLHLLDLVGPLYLKGKRQRYYIYVCRDAFDGAVCLKLGRSRHMESILDFLGECWKTLGRPEQLQFDNAREFVGWGPAARYLSRVLRTCLRFGIEATVIPPAQPQRNGGVEWFNGWFQPPLLPRHYSNAHALKRELQRLQDTVNAQHVQRRLGGLTPDQHRRKQKLQKLPARFRISHDPLPLAPGRGTFIRQVTIHANIHLLGLTFKVPKRRKGQFVKAVLDTQRAQLTIYAQGRIIKRWPYPYLKP